MIISSVVSQQISYLNTITLVLDFGMKRLSSSQERRQSSVAALSHDTVHILTRPDVDLTAAASGSAHLINSSSNGRQVNACGHVDYMTKQRRDADEFI